MNVYRRNGLVVGVEYRGVTIGDTAGEKEHINSPFNAVLFGYYTERIAQSGGQKCWMPST